MCKKTLSVIAWVVLIAFFAGYTSSNSNIGYAESGADPNQALSSSVDSTESEGFTFKVAAVLGLGGLGDGSLSDAVYSGLVQAENEFGVIIQVIEPREIAEFEGHFAELSRSGEYDLLVGAGYDQGEAIARVSRVFPNQMYLLVDGFVDNDTNVIAVSYANNERSFAVGMLAAMMTETNHVGVIGGMDAPFLHNSIAGYIAGARYANPDVEVSVKYTNSWSDTVLAKEIAIAMFDDSVDIIYNQAGGAGLGIYAAANEKGFYAIGTETNQNPLFPDHIVASALSLMGDTVFRGIKDAIDGSLKPGSVTRGFAEDGIGYTIEGSNITTPDEVINLLDQTIEKIKLGEIVVPEAFEEVDPFLEANRR